MVGDREVASDGRNLDMNDTLQVKVEKVFKRYATNALRYELDASSEKSAQLYFRKAQLNHTEEGRTILG